MWLNLRIGMEKSRFWYSSKRVFFCILSQRKQYERAIVTRTIHLIWLIPVAHPVILMLTGCFSFQWGGPWDRRDWPVYRDSWYVISKTSVAVLDHLCNVLCVGIQDFQSYTRRRHYVYVYIIFYWIFLLPFQGPSGPDGSKGESGDPGENVRTHLRIFYYCRRLRTFFY